MNLFELFVKVGVDDQASKNISNITQKLGNGLKTAAKIGTAAVSAASAGIVALTKSAVENYAEYEQLVGGVDTLFKNASQKVQQYASEAYKTAGMSANDYMENATAFSASLINALGGDTEAAAEYANRAMVSMSDNANKMGTNIDSIVQTYQSLSRGNFAMLDNLKLGYGGTKAELERLIEDAASYTDIQDKMGITVDKSSMSFDNIVNAIAVVQGHLGIAGATAQEAATTIEGSVNSMKASWSNLITGIADENADFGGLVDQFVDSAVAVGENLLPRIQVALTGAGDLIDKLVPVIVEKIPKIVNENLPNLTKTAVSIVKSLISGVSENQQELFNTIFDVVVFIVDSFITMLPDVVKLGLELIVSLAEGIADALPELIPTVFLIIDEIVNTIFEGDTLKKLFNAALEIILALAEGIGDNTPQLIDTIFALVDGIVNFLLDPENITKLINAALRIVIALAGGLISAIPRLVLGVFDLIDSIVDTFKEADWGQVGKNLVDGLLAGLKNAWRDVKSWFKASFNGIVSDVKGWLGIHSPSTVFESIGKFVDLGLEKGLEEFANLPVKAMENMSDDIYNAFDDGYDMEYAIDTASAPYEGDTFTESLANAMNALIAVEEDRKIEVEVSINGSDTETGRMLLNLINVTAKEVYA